MARSLPGRSLITPENARRSAAGECCAPASDRRPATLREKAPALTCDRPTPVGLALPRVGRLALGARCRPARNSRCLAPQGIPPFLDLEDPERQGWAAGRPTRGSRPDPPHEQRESGLGCAAYSRRASEARHQHRRDEREQVSRPQPEAAVPDLADLP